jgi:hypothetical protein
VNEGASVPRKSLIRSFNLLLLKYLNDKFAVNTLSTAMAAKSLTMLPFPFFNFQGNSALKASPADLIGSKWRLPVRERQAPPLGSRESRFAKGFSKRK